MSILSFSGNSEIKKLTVSEDALTWQSSGWAKHVTGRKRYTKIMIMDIDFMAMLKAIEGTKKKTFIHDFNLIDRIKVLLTEYLFESRVYRPC